MKRVTMVSKKSTLENFEIIFGKVLERNNAAVEKIATRRNSVIQREIESIGQQKIKRMTDIKSLHTKQIKELQSLQQTLYTKVKSKWAGITIKNNSYKSTLTEGQMPVVPSANQYSSSSYFYSQAKRILEEAITYTSSEMPFFAKRRGDLWHSEQPKAIEALQIGTQAIVNEERALASELTNESSAIYSAISALASKKSIIEPDKKSVSDFNDKLNLTPVGGSVGEGIPYPLLKTQKGHGRLLFQCGWIAHTANIRTSNGVFSIGYTPLFVPCVIDLVREHGFLTTDANTVKSFVLRMLNTLPSGSVTFSVYDPKTMGDFVKYLYPLGDKQELILGKHGVFSTPNQLQALLEETERHIGIINQKYLAGKYSDLVDYNKDAGVSFEPYRVLVINDNPMSWAAGYRQELVGQLTRIIDAGSKCGVFVIINSDTACSIGLPTLIPGYQNLSSQFASKAYLAGKTVKAIVPEEIMRSGNLSGCYTIEETVVWVSPDNSWIRIQGQEEIVNTLEKELQNVGVVEVSPQNVALISRFYRNAQGSKGVKFGPPVIEFDDPTGWWRESSQNGITAYVGIDKANQKKPRVISFRGTPGEFGALVGGQSRSGKSTFLHALISEFIRRYSPYELELYLIDVKFGAEFKHYANVHLPHARVIALESGAEFALSVLKDLTENMAKRYTLFKQEGVSKIDDYREKTRKVMPRILAIIDEFSGMFEVENTISEEATILLTKLIQQGSAAGVHLILASQSLATAVAIPRNVLPQIPQRIVFKVPEQDSRLFLADDNPQGSSLNRAGEGIYNPSNGRKDANEGFQGTLMSHADLKTTLKQIALLAKTKGTAKKPIILENPGATKWTPESIKIAKSAVMNLNVNVPIGMPLSLGSCVSVSLEQTVSGNALVCIHNDTVYIDVVSTFALGCALGGAKILLLDFFGTSGKLDAAFGKYESLLTQKNSRKFSAVRGQAIYSAITKLAAQTEEALSENKTLPSPVVVVISGLSQATNLNQLSPVAVQFQDLLNKGAAVGIHIIVAADSLGTAKSKLGYSWQDFFSIFISGSCGNSDSMELVQSRIASSLESDEQIVVFDRMTGKTQKVRPLKLSSFPMKS
jgi:hypothetical protein